MPSNLTIVYFISINPNRNWREIILCQLNDLNNFNIIKNTHLKIILSCIENPLLNEAFSYICNILNTMNDVSYIISISSDNLYEYRGIKYLYDSAKENPSLIYLYIHTKGMYNVADLNKRSITEKTLLHETVTNWKGILNLFETDKDLMKVSLFPDENGLSWYNFYFARGSYLANCEEPIITDNRYYYEHWLGYNTEKNSKSYSLFSRNEKKYTPQEAIIYIIQLSAKYSV